MENNNYSENQEQVTGKETQISQLTQEPDVQLDESQHRKLSKLLKQMVTKVIAPIRAAREHETETNDEGPASMAVPSTMKEPEYHAIHFVAAPDAGTTKRGRKTTNKVVDEISVDFKLPDQDPIFNEINIDKLKLSLDDDRECQFSFLQRLQGWKIQCRQRPKGEHLDWYYNHTLSGKKFRSIKELIKFFLYELYADTNHQKEKLIFEENQKNAENWEKIYSLIENSGKHKMLIEDFFQNANKNFICDESKKSILETFVEENKIAGYQGFSSGCNQENTNEEKAEGSATPTPTELIRENIDQRSVQVNLTEGHQEFEMAPENDMEIDGK
ncbi:Methyl-CpG-binding domain-containing protein 6-like [Quillaja saponaria]|uniref:Methyl-CpG-binding domain-containing protein 6-like n=1 Tax=Quillaja saponaria TaxID=32244 RepID=A0AAD7QCE6_QUISA|nr:Methyl-CpG-binding domain-containing protein 6-like [Quillaja saponaria]